MYKYKSYFFNALKFRALVVLLWPRSGRRYFGVYFYGRIHVAAEENFRGVLLSRPATRGLWVDTTLLTNERWRAARSLFQTILPRLVIDGSVAIAGTVTGDSAFLHTCLRHRGRLSSRHWSDIARNFHDCRALVRTLKT
jgi:hypothetical protein